MLGKGTFAKVYYAKHLVTGESVAIKVMNKDQVKKLISAVDFCHSRGVSHRDLKPENLLLDENEDLKVSDFGLSALPEQLWNDGLLHTQCGTPAYVAPEVLRKKGYDGARADLWSCGVILFVLLAGFLPFQDENLMKMYRKIFKAEFDCPPWVSAEGRRLISKLLVADPARRITIPAIMRVPWFRKGLLSQPIQNNREEEEESGGEEGNNNSRSTKISSPKFFNAFEFISSMSSGFDLSSLFETKRRRGSIFTSRSSATAIMARIEGFAKGINFRVGKVKDFKMSLVGPCEGRKGRLSMTAEVFEVAPEVAIVEFSKSAGDTLEYAKFCEEDARPALKDIVWTWQGDTVCNGNGTVNGYVEDHPIQSQSLM
ncbi:CBL-interacting serine/threonine-protein kinase 5 [Linum perenne]